VKAEPTLAAFGEAGKFGRLIDRLGVGDGDGKAAGDYRKFAVHGSITSTPHPSKSAKFRVANVAPRERAMAAIAASKALIGRPARRRVAPMSA